MVKDLDPHLCTSKCAILTIKVHNEMPLKSFLKEHFSRSDLIYHYFYGIVKDRIDLNPLCYKANKDMIYQNSGFFLFLPFLSLIRDNFRACLKKRDQLYHFPSYYIQK
jgi:hypothetical protein